MWDGEAWAGLIWLMIRDRWQMLFNAVINLWVPLHAVNFLTR